MLLLFFLLDRTLGHGHVVASAALTFLLFLWSQKARLLHLLFDF